MATTEERDIFNNEYVQIYTNGSGNIVLLFQNEVGKSQSKIKIWSLLERETDSSVTGI